MGFHCAVFHLDHIDSQVGAMVCHTLIVHGDICQRKSQADGALPVLTALDMALFYLLVQPVNYFL